MLARLSSLSTAPTYTGADALRYAEGSTSSETGERELSNSLHEALREFVATRQASGSEQARKDLDALDELDAGTLAEQEDAAFGILARLYGDLPGTGKGGAKKS